MKGPGRIQKGIARAFRLDPGRSWTTRELLAWTHGPRSRRWPLRERRNACRGIRLVADQVAVRAGRRWPDGVLWRARADILSVPHR
jgi:hypothetical protein